MIEYDIDKIRARAYEIFQWRICYGVEGDSIADWLQAEEEIKQDDLWKERQMKGLGDNNEEDNV